MLGGLLEGEPRRDAKAFATYSNWIDTKAMIAATSIKPNHKGYIIEWSIALNPCVEVEPGKFWSPAMGDREVGINIALGNTNLSECEAFDPDANGGVTVDEIIQAINNALSGCQR